jgi:hypothetical protein
VSRRRRESGVSLAGFGASLSACGRSYAAPTPVRLVPPPVLRTYRVVMAESGWCVASVQAHDAAQAVRFARLANPMLVASPCTLRAEVV